MARATFTGYDQGAVVLSIDELFRGPLRSVGYELVARDDHCRACFVGPLGKGRGERGDTWLVIAGGIGGVALAEGGMGNRSLLMPVTMKGPGCLRAGEADASVKEGMIWMTPWALLNQEVVEEIRVDGGEGDLWWRRNHAWMEFAAAMGRVGLSVGQEVVRKADAGRVGRGAGKVGEVTMGVEGEWWVRDGVSLVAACKDRTSTLAQALRSWIRVRGVDEIVLVDWSSSPAVVDDLPEDLLRSEKITLIRVAGQNDWMLSRAYNLAARVASYTRLTKVDCDTYLEPGFLEAHTLKRGSFYAGDWRQLESGISDELHVNGLLYVYRDEYLAVGGYDERITTYGWDDSDITQRLSKVSTSARFDYNKVRHIAHPASLRVVNQRTQSVLPPENPHAAAVEIQRNRLLLTKFNIPEWKATSLHTQWNISPETLHKPRGVYGTKRLFTAISANEVTSITSLVSDADALDVAKRAVRLILQRYGVQLLPKTLTLDFYKELITKVAFPERYAEVVLSLRGGCASRLLAYAASNQAATGSRLKDAPSELADSSYIWPPLPYRGWRLQGLWNYPDQECSCKFSNVFDAREEEIIPAWFDKANPLHKYIPINEHQPSVDVATLLKSFDAKAKEKVLSADLRKWMMNSTRYRHKPRILMDDLACDLDPRNLTAHRRDLTRSQFRRLVPSKDIQETVTSSLTKEEPTILDMAILSKDFWPKLVGADFATYVTDAFTSAPLTAMANGWGPTSIPSNQLAHRLDLRAASLTVALRVLENGVYALDQLTASQAQQLNETAATLSKRIERLFIGCPTPASSYLEAYPELALALAGFLTCGTCV